MAEPEELDAIRRVAKYHDLGPISMLIDRRGAMRVVEYLDTLTAERDALRARVEAVRNIPRYAQFDEWKFISHSRGKWIKAVHLRRALENPEK